MRLLITDVLYPNRYATWRNVMIEYLIRNTDAEVLVFKTRCFGSLASFDFDFCNRDGLLDGYRVVRKKRWPRDAYLLTRGEFGGYDAVYHLFVACWGVFNKHFANVPPERQFVHLYPGGGYRFASSSFPAGTGIISTHPETTALHSGQKMIECLFGVHVHSAEQIVSRDFHHKPELTICFSSVGAPKFKGDATYLRVADLYASQFPEDRVRFVSIGNCMSHPRVQHHPAMDYVSLWDFYRDKVDIYLSAETGLTPNGWPLGLEAAVTGCVLLTTDTRNTAAKLDLPIPSVLTCHDAEEFVAAIRRLYLDREYASLCSRNTRLFLLRHVAPAAQQDRILDFIRNERCPL